MKKQNLHIPIQFSHSSQKSKQELILVESRDGVKGPCRAPQIRVFLLPDRPPRIYLVYSDTDGTCYFFDYLFLIKTIVYNVFIRNPKIPRLIILTEASV